jgi:hypothetical protein
MGEDQGEGRNDMGIQKSKVKNQNDNPKREAFDLCSVILHFYSYSSHSEGTCGRESVRRLPPYL